ncbi:hypothetical protein BurJ1DRAFT_2646 [Burkholderiales bacterium JOSHI_001]|nr:hypothetical protein BurJ1DRAFT_2646 [Burkholderiales bacterium JOSHI_001]
MGLMEQIKSKLGGKSVKACPLKTGVVAVVVTRADTGAPVQGAKVSITGPSPGSDTTSDIGAAIFEGRTPGDYKAKVGLSGAMKTWRLQELNVADSVAAASLTLMRADVQPLGDLVVKVVDDQGRTVKDALQLNASGAFTGGHNTNSGSHTFEKIPSGKYKVDVAAPFDLFENPQESKSDVVVPEGGKVTVQLVLRILNAVTPVIDSKKTEVLYEPLPPPDPNVAVPPPPPPNAETPLHLKLRYTETRSEKPFRDGGVFALDRGTVDVFRNEACTTKLALGPGNDFRFSNAQLSAGVDLYLRDRDRTAGPLVATLTLDPPADAAIRALGPTQRGLLIKALNVVQPKIVPEYKVVLLERGLHKHQKNDKGQAEADLHWAGATRIELSATQTGGVPAHPYNGGGKVSVSPSHVELFTHPDCKPDQKFEPSTAITNAQLFGLVPFELWLRGKAKGKVTVKLTMDDPKDGLIRVKPPAAEDLSVVELLGTLHRQNISAIKAFKVDPYTEPESDYHTGLKDLVWPEQKPVSDELKVQGKRWLHLQVASPTGDPSHGRAKLLLPKLNAADWPAETDDYKLVIKVEGADGAVTLHDKENENAATTQPWEFKVSDLKTAEKVLWVEGSGESKALHDCKLDIGLTRADAVEKHTAAKRDLRNGDWMRFTVLSIDPAEIKIDYTPEGDEFNAWDATSNPKRFYINVNKKGDPEGRRIKVQMQLKPHLAGVPVRFMLVADKDNHKTGNWGFDFPADAKRKDGKGVKQDFKWKDVKTSWKHKDKPDRKDVLHWGEVTDKDGKAKTKLKLSRVGGDKFRLGIYIDEDAHLAKHIDGHPELGKRVPVTSALGDIQVWRRVFYQATRPQNLALPALAGFDNSQERVFLGPELVNQHQMTPGDFSVDPMRPHWQYNPNSGDNTLKLCIGTHNIKDALKLFQKAEKKTTPKFHVIMCDEQFDAKDGRTHTTELIFDDADPGPQDEAMDSAQMQTHKVSIFDPPLQGGALAMTAKWEMLEHDGAKWKVRAKGKLPVAKIEVRADRDSRRKVRVSPPDGQPIDATHCIRVTIKLRAADGGYLGWAPNDSVAAVIKGGRADASMQDTMAHEMAHLFGQTRYKTKEGMPDHPLYYQRRGGSGTHCAHGAAWTAGNPGDPALDPKKSGQLDAQGHGAGKYDNGDCILFAYGLPNKVEWCEHCALDFVLSDLSKLNH